MTNEKVRGRSPLEVEGDKAGDIELEVEMMKTIELCHGRESRRKRMWMLEKAPRMR